MTNDVTRDRLFGWKPVLFAVALALFACFGCAAPVSEAEQAEPLAFGDAIAISEAFPASERAVIDSAFADWAQATGGSAFFVRSDSADWLIERAVLDYGLGRSNRLARLVIIDGDAISPPGTTTFESELKAVTLHELGHAMGLEHGDGSLMDQYVGDCIDAASVSALCALQPCAAQRPTCD
jgi:hypothetical protein